MTENKVVPKLRFAKFKNEKDTNSYKKYSFTDVFLFSTGKNIKQNEASPQFKTPCVRYGELYHMYGEVIYNVINKTNLPESELLFSKGNEILLPSAGEEPIGIGAASALPFKNIAIGRTINVLSPRIEEMYSQYYVSYYINEKLKKKIARLAKGVSISNVYNSDLKKLKIILPSLKEQQKVDSFLSAVDKKLQQLTKKKELLEEYKKGVMQKIFSREIRFKDDNGNSYPDWEEKKLGDLCELKNGYAFKSSKYVSEGFYKIVTIKNVQDGKMVDGFNTINIIPTNLEDHQILQLNDILISMTGNVGRVCRVKFKNCILNQRVGKFITKDIFEDYLYYSLNSKQFLKSMENIGQGAAQLNIGKKEILGFKRLHPTSKKEQKKIADFLSAIDDKIDTTSTQIDKNKEFKKGLLQQMFV